MSYFQWQNRVPAEGYAAQLLHALGINQFPLNIHEVTAAVGLRYAERDLGVDGIYGWLHREGKPTVYINSRITSEERKKFTAAHEVGHWVIKDHDKPEYQCSPFDIESSYSTAARKAEKEANRFATELLMPERQVRDFLSRRDFTFLTVKDMAEKFGTSLTASALRVVEFSQERCAVVLSHRGKILWSVESRPFQFTINRGLVHEHSYATDLFQGIQTMQTSFDQVHPRAWICDRVVPDNIVVEEYSHHYPDLAMVLSLIRIPANTDEEYDEE